MFVIPAIDIKDGKCVRLFQGDFNQVTTYSDDPVKTAQAFVGNKAQMLNIIDLDGAKSGAPVNKQLILEIIKAVTIPVQVGGGLRTYKDAKDYLGAGARRVILSTAAIKDAALVKRLIDDFGDDSIIIAADIKDGEFATDGWTKSGGKSIQASIRLLKNLGVTFVLVTDVSKDGSLTGPNFELVQQFINAGLQIIGAGGIATLSDIVELNKRGAYGAVVGKAVYEGSINIPEAQAAVTYTNNLAKRIIPCLDVKDGRVVKGTNFTDLRIVGDPVAIARRYDQSGADELVFLDIAATIEERKTFRRLVEQIAQAITIPFTVGGGIGSLEDIKVLLQAGADKVSIGSAAVLRPDFVLQAVNYFGSQCIVISVDAKKQEEDWQVYTKGGTEASGVGAVAFCKQMEKLGVGELLVNSLDRDGINSGFDLELLQAINECVNIPVIASSGGGSPQDFLDVFKKTGVDAALGASIFHYHDITPAELKTFLAHNNVGVRL
jgi:cyclase